MKCWDLEMTDYIDLSELKPDKKNARKHNPRNISMLTDAIQEIGVSRSGVIDEDGNILAGNGTFEALSEAGIRKVRVVDVDGEEWVVVRRTGLTNAEKTKLSLYDNRTAELAEWDPGILKEIYKEDHEIFKGLFYDDELDSYLDDGNKDVTELEGEDDVLEIPEEPITQIGDIYQIGEHRILCGDATKAEDVEKLMNGQKAEFCFTSPPYLNLRDYGGTDLSVGKLKKFISIGSKYCDFFAVNLGIVRRDGSIVRYWDEYIEEAGNAGLKLTSWNIWSRSGMGGSIGNMTAMFPIEHEWIFIFGGSKERVNYTRENKEPGKSCSGSFRQKGGKIKKIRSMKIATHSRIGSVYEQCYDNTGKHHPSAFPVAFPQEYIKACSDDSDNIYDPFGGSGSTLIACEKLNRKCNMIEIDPGYCDIIVSRFKNLFPHKPVRKETLR